MRSMPNLDKSKNCLIVDLNCFVSIRITLIKNHSWLTGRIGQEQESAVLESPAMKTPMSKEEND